MAAERERLLSEFIDAWNAGERPSVDEFVSRAPVAERGELADSLVAFLSVAPTPSYGEASLEEIRAEPAVAAALSAPGERGGLLPSLLVGLRERFSMTVADVAGELVGVLGLPPERASKTASYLERLERGELDPGRVSRRVTAALASIFRVARDEIEGAGTIGGWGPRAAPVFRGDSDAAAAVSRHLDVLADALEAPGGGERDEVDDLFLGGR